MVAGGGRGLNGLDNDQAAVTRGRDGATMTDRESSSDTDTTGLHLIEPVGYLEMLALLAAVTFRFALPPSRRFVAHRMRWR